MQFSSSVVIPDEDAFDTPKLKKMLKTAINVIVNILIISSK